MTLATAFILFADVSEKIDPFIHTEAEAAEEHHAIMMVEEDHQQTQAGFNAYTLRLLLEQEIGILILKIESEEDAVEKTLLQAELESKQEFIRQLEKEEREQMMKGTSG